MTFADIPAGASVFVDANMLVYHFAFDPLFGPACTNLLHRIKRREIVGYTSTHIVAEMAHRLMAIEAINAFGWPTPAEKPQRRATADAVSAGCSRGAGI